MECTCFLHALPCDAPSSNTDLTLAFNVERAYDLVWLAHSSMAAGTLAESLWVASKIFRSYADVYGGRGVWGAIG